jgi:hypothetical protein
MEGQRRRESKKIEKRLLAGFFPSAQDLNLFIFPNTVS